MAISTPKETGRPVTIKDEGLTLVENVASIDFAGDGVSGTALGVAATETIDGAGGAWGSITGTLSSQTDLQTALDARITDPGTQVEDYVLSIVGGAVAWAASTGVGDVSASAVISDNALVRGDGGSKGVQSSGILIDDSDNVAGMATIGTTGERVTKLWAVDLTVTNTITGTIVNGIVSSGAITNNVLTRGDGGGRSIQQTGITVDDSDNVVGILQTLNSPTYTSLQEFIDTSHSNGVISGGEITDGGSGTVDIAAGTIMIRSSNSDIAKIYSADFPAVTGQALTDDALNILHVQYAAGTPVVRVGTQALTDPNSNVILGSVYRASSVLHITNIQVPASQAIQKLSLRLGQIEGLTRATGAILSETGTQNIALTAGTFWVAINQISTTSYDSSGADTFSTWHDDNAGGFTETTSQSAISNTKYDDGDGTLGDLSNNKYGVHWVYIGTDDVVSVVYGTGDYTLTDAEDATAPTNIPAHLTVLHATLAGKIVIKKDATSFTTIQSAFVQSFPVGISSDHTDLSGLAWTSSGHTGTASNIAGFNGSGAAAEYTLSGTGTVLPTTTSPTFVTPLLGTPTSGVLTNATGYPGDSSLITTGTVGTGTWEGDVVDHERGGIELDISAITTGGILRGASAGVMSILTVGPDGQVLTAQADGSVAWEAVAGTGDVIGDTASADKELVRFNGTGGKTIESPVTDLSTTTATLSDNADLTLYDNVNDGNPIIAFGSSATERLQITSSYASGGVALEFVEFDTPTASATADRGEYRFKVDAALIATIDDGGIELADGFSYFVDTSNVLSETALGTTVVTSALTTLGTQAEDLVMGDNQITGVDNITFTDTAGAVAGIQNQNLLDKAATEAITGAWDFGGAADFEIPNSATPTVDTAGQIAIDTTPPTEFAEDTLIFWGGAKVMYAVTLAADELPSGATEDGYTVNYNATNNEFELVVAVAGGGDVAGDTASADKEFVRFNGTGGKTIESPVTDDASTTATLSDTADVTFYDANNDGNPVFSYGSSATNRLTITPTYGSGAQTIEFVEFETLSSSATADFGEFRFNVDEALIATIDDGGIEIKASGSLSFGAIDILTDSTGTTTLNNIDVLDATTETTIESAIDTLANLTSIQSLTVTLADAAADAILGWDDTAGAYENLTQAEVLAVIGDSSLTAKGVIEIATIAETNTGTDAGRAVSPDGLDGWTGSAQVVTLGTITTGVWTGTTVAVADGGTGVTTSTGTGNVVLSSSPTLVTPALGTPASGVMTNVSGTAASLTAGTVTTNANLTGPVTSIGNATAIADKALAIAKLADGTDGELITWSATGVIETVAVGSANEVLTSNGAGAAPTFQAAGAADNLGNHIATQDLLSDTDNTDALGTAAVGWSDLWLGNLSVINWSTAPSTLDVTLTHAANTLTFAGGTIVLGTATATGGLTGDITGDASGSAATVTGAAQTAITSLGTLTTLTVDNITINGSTISHATAVDLVITATIGNAVAIEGVSFDGGVVTGASSITSTTLVGELTGNAATVTTITGLAPDTATTQATQAAITSAANLATVGTITSGTWQGTTVAVNQGGTGVTSSTGTTNVVLSNSPTLVTPALGTPASGVATNITGLPAAAILPGTLVAGTYLLAENASIGLDPAGSADGKYTGITFTATAGETVAFGDVVYLKAADSEWYLADADAVATSGTVAIAICVTAGTDGNAVTLMSHGIIRADAGFPALTIGAPVYISLTGTTTNTVTVTAPSAADDVVRIIGYAITADEILFSPSPDHITTTG